MTMALHKNKIFYIQCLITSSAQLRSSSNIIVLFFLGQYTKVWVLIQLSVVFTIIKKTGCCVVGNSIEIMHHFNFI